MRLRRRGIKAKRLEAFGSILGRRISRVDHRHAMHLGNYVFITFTDGQKKEFWYGERVLGYVPPLREETP